MSLERIRLISPGNGDGTATLDIISISRAGEMYEFAKRQGAEFHWNVGNWELVFNVNGGS